MTTTLYNRLTQINMSWLLPFFQNVYKLMSKEDKAMTSEMQKEIFEQPNILRNLVEKYITKDNDIAFSLPLYIKRIKFIASGSSYHCAGIVSKIFREYANIQASCDYASEFYISKNIFIDEKTLYVFISQSGETSDTLKSLEKVKEQGGKTLCITNKEKSSIWNLCDYKILSFAGEEKSIASTKALSAQLLCLYLVMLEYLSSKGHEIHEEVAEIKKLPEFLDSYLADTTKIKKVAKILAPFKNIAIIGAKSYYSLAKEGALKIKETSYIDSNAYPQGEFLHGHVALLNNKAALISIMVDETQETAMEIIKKVKEDYNPRIVTISNEKIVENSTINIEIGTKSSIYNVFGVLITFQLLAFEIAKRLGRNIDKPKGLKKVVK